MLMTGKSGSSIGRLLLILLPLLLAILAGCPDTAWALQSHGPPEGLYVHQMAHIHFVLALGYLLWDIRRSSFTSRGWRYLQVFCVLMIAWNVLAFTGHAMGVVLEPHHISTVEGYFRSRLVGPLTMGKIIFYITKLDHIVAVPALFFLFIAMRSFYRTVVKHAGEEKK